MCKVREENQFLVFSPLTSHHVCGGCLKQSAHSANTFPLLFLFLEEIIVSWRPQPSVTLCHCKTHYQSLEIQGTLSFPNTCNTDLIIPRSSYPPRDVMVTRRSVGRQRCHWCRNLSRGWCLRRHRSLCRADSQCSIPSGRRNLLESAKVR